MISIFFFFFWILNFLFPNSFNLLSFKQTKKMTIGISTHYLDYCSDLGMWCLFFSFLFFSFFFFFFFFFLLFFSLTSPFSLSLLSLLSFSLSLFLSFSLSLSLFLSPSSFFRDSDFSSLSSFSFLIFFIFFLSSFLPNVGLLVLGEEWVTSFFERLGFGIGGFDLSHW